MSINFYYLIKKYTIIIINNIIPKTLVSIVSFWDKYFPSRKPRQVNVQLNVENIIEAIIGVLVI